ncbi:Ankyrin repeats (3 copies) [Popillia japonica]|uniref:Ankyrin repeats (3 copies) n=1 Tax=Popillia japonica TaxID=7064 RepID=A0AAW1MQ86_POPJA
MKQSLEELALLRLFGEEKTKNVLVTISLDWLLTKQIRTGIITGVDDRIPIFIHFTFVEYFVSQWFVRSLGKPLLKQYAINFYKQLLIDKHARILEIEFEQSSLQNAIVEGKVLRVQQMLRDNLECLEYIDRFNRTVLHIRFNRTVLHIAAIHCRYHTHRHDPGYKILDKILQSMKNHNPDYISKHDMSGMTWAEYVNKEVFENIVLNNLFATVEVYLKTEAQNVKENDNSGVFPLDQESFEKIFKVVKWRRLSINIIRDLFFLQNYHNKKIRKFLEQCRNDTPSSDLGWDTGRVDGLLAPLHVACIYNSLRIVQRFIEVEYNVNVTDQYQCTPLYYNVIQFSQEPDASRDDKLAIAKLLLSNGADITQPDRGCGTMLYSAVRSRNIDIVEMLTGHVNSTKIPKITKKEYMNMQNRDSSSPSSCYSKW